jgi:AcrR family transcriptional regulator
VSEVAAEPAPTVTRGARRRERTRARLLEAARTLFAKQGVDATRINEITEEADVGFGSFYNHFTDKEAIVEAVLAESAEAHGAIVDKLTEGLSDPAEVVAVAHRHFVRLAADDPTWAWLVIRLDVSHRLMTQALGPRALRDMQQGVDSGRFDIPDLSLALYAVGGALLGVMRGVLDSAVEDSADIRHAETILRMLGVPPAEAAEVARRPLPDAA